MNWYASQPTANRPITSPTRFADWMSSSYRVPERNETASRTSTTPARTPDSGSRSHSEYPMQTHDSASVKYVHRRKAKSDGITTTQNAKRKTQVVKTIFTSSCCVLRLASLRGNEPVLRRGRVHCRA